MIEIHPGIDYKRRNTQFAMQLFGDSTRLFGNEYYPIHGPDHSTPSGGVKHTRFVNVLVKQDLGSLPNRGADWGTKCRSVFDHYHFGSQVTRHLPGCLRVFDLVQKLMSPDEHLQPEWKMPLEKSWLHSTTVIQDSSARLTSSRLTSNGPARQYRTGIG